MIETLETLIKVAQQELNECLQNIKTVQEKIDQQQAMINQHALAIKMEAQNLSSVQDRLLYNNFAAAQKMHQENCRNIIHVLEGQLKIYMDLRQERFTTLKKYEILAEREVANLKKSMDEKMQAELDEISLSKYTQT